MKNNYLYKYKNYNNYTKKELENKEIWASHPNMFNDPFDSLKPLELMLNKVKGKKLEFSENTKQQQVLNNIRLGNFGIISLTPINNNTLMWAHYADSHKGLAYEFEFNKQIKSASDKYFYPFLGSKKNGAVKVNYLKKKEKRELLTKETLIDNPIKIIHEGIYTKTYEWNYEKEYRVLLPFDISNSLEEIINGWLKAIEPEDIQKIKNLKNIISETNIEKGIRANEKIVDILQRIKTRYKEFIDNNIDITQPALEQLKEKIENIYKFRINKNSIYDNCESIKQITREINDLINKIELSKEEVEITEASKRINEVLTLYTFIINTFIEKLDKIINILTLGSTVKYEKLNLFRLNSIIFGMNMPKEQKEEIIDIVNNSWGTGNINFKEVIEKKDSFELEIIEYKALN